MTPRSRSATITEEYGAAAETPNEFPLSSLRPLARYGLSVPTLIPAQPRLG